MIKINWDEFKVYKQHSGIKDDNFETLLNFLKSYYNMTNPTEMFDTMANDDIALMMLEKRDMGSAVDLEKHLFKNFEV